MPFDHTTLKTFRRQVRLTQAELARKLQVPQSTIARWESGAVTPTARHLGTLCDLGRVAAIEPSFFFPAFNRLPRKENP
ncbi:MAG TPA: XRE family transcriptional regulator [Candidatus Latescibacteria bacterium]|nr:XRE family transcriptional regulator [Candidatus Handelsmanbacteria bacterium]HIL11824.1 XRE family transcriptional regulator [Candidatus Latescibacterota bacterium]